jgi:hypothetical protein
LESEKCCHSRIRTRAYIRDDVVTPLPPFTGSPSGSLRVLELGMPEKPALQGGSGPGHPPWPGIGGTERGQGPLDLVRVACSAVEEAHYAPSHWPYISSQPQRLIFLSGVIHHLTDLGGQSRQSSGIVIVKNANWFYLISSI